MERHIEDLYKPWVEMAECNGEQFVRYYPPLLDMIGDACGTHSGDSHGSSVSGSRAPLNLSALDLAQRIERQSRGVAHALALPYRRDTRARLAAIAHAIAHGDDGDAQRRALDIAHRWINDARELLGIDAAPYVPHARCPNVDCERWSTVRVALSDRTAHCSACGDSWDSDRFDSLARWVDWSAHHLTDSRHACAECADERAAMAQRDAARRIAPRAA